MLAVRHWLLLPRSGARWTSTSSHPIKGATEFVRQLRDPSVCHAELLRSPVARQIDPATVSDALWKTIYDKHYERVLAIHRDIHLTEQPRHQTAVSVHLAAMAASGSLGQTERLLEILSTVQRQREDKQQRLVATERFLSVLVQSLCAVEELPSAEKLLLSWLDRSIKQRSHAPSTHPHAEKTERGTERETTTTTESPPPPPAAPLSVLRGLLKEWTSSVPAADSLADSEPVADDGELAALLAERDILSVESLDWSRLSAPVPLFVWASLLRAYAVNQQWRRCVLLLDVLEKEIALSTPSTNGFPSSSSGDKSPAVIPYDVLVSRRCPLESLSAPALRSVLFHHTLFAVCAAHRGPDLALALTEKMRALQIPLSEFSVTLSLLKCFSSSALSLSPALMEKDLLQKRTALLSLAPMFQRQVLVLLAQEEGYHAAKTLVKELMHVMGRLGLVEESEVFLRTLARHPSAAKFLTLPQLVHPLIHAYSKMPNQWNKTLELFDLIAHRHTEQPLSYHCVCESLHKAREFERLALFVDKYGAVEDSSFGENESIAQRQQRLRETLSEEEQWGRRMDEELFAFFSKSAPTSPKNSNNNTNEHSPRKVSKAQ